MSKKQAELPSRPREVSTAIAREMRNISICVSHPADVYRDWMEICYQTLRAIPRHLASALETGNPAEDDDEARACWERFRDKYKSEDFERFSRAFAMLMSGFDGFWGGDIEAAEIVGYVYEELGANVHAGQFFTPSSIAKLMAEMQVGSGPEEVLVRIRDAIQRAAKASGAAEALLFAHALTMQAFADEGGESAWRFAERILPIIAPYFEPLTVCDPCCGGGIMLMAAVQQFPPWMAQMGLVQFFGQDIDPMCCRMTQVNLMLAGVGYGKIRFGDSLGRAAAPVGDQPGIRSPAESEAAVASAEDAYVLPSEGALFVIPATLQARSSPRIRRQPMAEIETGTLF